MNFKKQIILGVAAVSFFTACSTEEIPSAPGQSSLPVTTHVQLNVRSFGDASRVESSNGYNTLNGYFFSQGKLSLHYVCQVAGEIGHTIELPDSVGTLYFVADPATDFVSQITAQTTEQEFMQLTLEAGLKRKATAHNGLTGVDTGLTELNRITGGWQPGTLVCTAARPGDGKTALDLFFARAAARSGVPVVVFSMEMGARELGDRLLLGVADVDVDHWKAGGCTDCEMAEVDRAMEELRSLPIRVDDTPYNSVDQLCVVAKSLHAKGCCGLVVVDYLQLLDVAHPGRTREQEVAECCRKLKALARKLACPVIISSQLNRQSEGMPARVPELSHLRESGAIEQDSDMVLLLYRPERARMRVYGDRKLPTEGMVVAIVAKHRNGQTGEVIFRHNDSMTQMADW